MAYIGKVVLKGKEARDKLISGANFVADAVKSTLGPFGMNAVMEKKLKVTNDGFSIASEITLNDEIEDLGLRVFREACSKTNDEAGDGTTTAMVLAQAILKEGVRLLGDEDIIGGKIPTTELVRKIEAERVIVTEALTAAATPIETEEQLINSAIVSVEDKDLGTLIGKTQWELGKDGVLLAEETTAHECSVEKIQGIRTDNGFATSLIVNDEEKQQLSLENALVILTNNVFRDLKPVQALLEQVQQRIKSGALQTNKIVIVARSFTDEAVAICMKNIQNGVLMIYPVSAPYVDQTQVMKDIEAVVGGRFINYEESSLEDMQVSDIGFASKVIAKRFETIITGREDEKTIESVKARVAELQDKLAGSESEFEKGMLRSRIAQLTSGFAILKIGANSEVERKRLKDKADDAVNAVRAAFQEGTVPGAGMAYINAIESLPEGAILKKALTAPYDQIMSTAPSGFVVEDWVRDPLKVMRIALERACSVAADLATASIAIATERDRGCGHGGKSGPGAVHE